jgi:hypothetical protein
VSAYVFYRPKKQDVFLVLFIVLIKGNKYITTPCQEAEFEE